MKFTGQDAHIKQMINDSYSKALSEISIPDHAWVMFEGSNVACWGEQDEEFKLEFLNAASDIQTEYASDSSEEIKTHKVYAIGIDYRVVVGWAG